MDRMIYLDNAATTFPKPESVYEAQDRITRTLAVNAGRGSYRASSEASRIIANCRSKMSQLAGCKEDNLVFAPSATIAMNQIILGLPWNQYSVVYVSPYEHNAVARPLNRICRFLGSKLKRLSTKEDGQLDLEKIAIQFAKQPPTYVFISHVSNVTGYILPAREVAELAHEHGALVIVDCAQSMGLLGASLKTLDADFTVFAAHKTLYGSFGIGGVAAKDLRILNPAFCGGTGSDSLNLEMPEELPGRLEPASPNIIAIGALDEALSWRAGIPEGAIKEKENLLTERLIHGLCSNKRVKVYLTANQDNHIGVVSFNHEDYMADELGAILDQDFQIAVRTGYHCAPFVHDLIGSIPKRGTVRASVSYFTTEEDIDQLLAALGELD